MWNIILFVSEVCGEWTVSTIGIRVASERVKKSHIKHFQLPTDNRSNNQINGREVKFLWISFAWSSSNSDEDVKIEM